MTTGASTNTTIPEPSSPTLAAIQPPVIQSTEDDVKHVTETISNQSVTQSPTVVNSDDTGSAVVSPESTSIQKHSIKYESRPRAGLEYGLSQGFRTVVTWITFTLGLFGLFLSLTGWLKVQWDPEIIRTNYLLVYGIPAIAFLTTCLVCVFGWLTEGPDTIEVGLPNQPKMINLSGASGPLILWLITFSVIMTAANITFKTVSENNRLATSGMTAPATK